MKIAINGMLLNRHFCGVEISIYDLANALAYSGNEEYVFYVPTRFRAQIPKREHFRTVQTLVPAHLRPLRILWEHMILPGRLKRDRVDVLHAPGYIAPIKTSVPVVLTVYDIIALLRPELCKPSNRLYYGLMLQRSVKRADHIVVPSISTRNDLVKHLNAGEKKISVVNLGIKNRFSILHNAEKLTAARNKYGLTGKIILCVSRHEPKKNLVRLVEAYHSLKKNVAIPHQLVLAGEKDWGHQDVADKTRELGLEKEVVFTGFVPPEDLLCLYNIANLFVFPSLAEGFGLPPLEAMACGTPVICSNVGSLAEIAGTAAVLVDPMDVNDIARAIKDVLEQAPLRSSLIDEGFKQARRFSWQRAVGEMEKIYRETAEHSTRNC